MRAGKKILKRWGFLGVRKGRNDRLQSVNLTRINIYSSCILDTGFYGGAPPSDETTKYFKEMTRRTFYLTQHTENSRIVSPKSTLQVDSRGFHPQKNGIFSKLRCIFQEKPRKNLVNSEILSKLHPVFSR